MRIAAHLALVAGLGLSFAAGSTSLALPPEARKAQEECFARWKDVDGIWEGQLSTPGADFGGQFDKRVHVRLVFSRNGTTLLVKDKLHQPWKTVGDDPTPPRDKINLLVQIRSSDSRDPLGHSVVFSRLAESSAKVIYSRSNIDPKPGELVSNEDLRAGVVAREGSPVPTGLAAELRECAPKLPARRP